ncbi:hypothetical protein E3N88_31862 [Mikania micrantha]|uniref:Uncharacterized protein n=1 Tax=Mikania micrantha TaxID=192012 RepID=A0A5N6M7J7_9ASTR|nr:hypothetical protein E3N88_31862 [Mikania micrantha]
MNPQPRVISLKFSDLSDDFLDQNTENKSKPIEINPQFEVKVEPHGSESKTVVPVRAKICRNLEDPILKTKDRLFEPKAPQASKNGAETAVRRSKSTKPVAEPSMKNNKKKTDANESGSDNFKRVIDIVKGFDIILQDFGSRLDTIGSKVDSLSLITGNKRSCLSGLEEKGKNKKKRKMKYDSSDSSGETGDDDNEDQPEDGLAGEFKEAVAAAKNDPGDGFIGEVLLKLLQTDVSKEMAPSVTSLSLMFLKARGREMELTEMMVMDPNQKKMLVNALNISLLC